MSPAKKTAHLAGLSYFFVTLMGPFVLLYVPGKLFVPTDAALTVANIVAHEGLFRAYIVIGIVSEFFFISAILLLYKLLKPVNRHLAMLMVFCILLDVPQAFIGAANNVATLAFAKGADFLSVFDKPQRDAITMLLINIQHHGVLVSEIFWGLWLLPLGILIFRSGLMPRLLGIWLFINGIAYLLISFTGLILPDYLKLIQKITFPFLFGEMALMLWLLFMGVKQKKSDINLSAV